ncbi:MAG TPA: C1 family peptidase, partial [Burkholderiaceae bacterium]|nr:C1 family peptidase [Burkholderiaceae bacterium]
PPADGWHIDAAQRPLGVYYRIDKRSVVDLQAAIQEIGAIYVSARAHDGWDDVLERPAPRSHADLPVIPPRSAKSKTGGHAFALVGYNEIGFIVQNSWGENWGAGGFAVLPYADWIRHATDAWACALGVAQDLRLNAARIEALRWPQPSGRSLGFFDLSVKSPNNPPDDPWPIDREYEHAPYEPWSTAKAYAHTLVTGNDGVVEITDLAVGATGDVERFVDGLVVEAPLATLAQMDTPRLMIYAHGGLNSRDDSIARIRVLAPYFEANGIYPLFLTWRTGPVETLVDILQDKLRSIFGIETDEQARAAGFFDDLKEARDRRVEEIAHVAVKGLWTEMRENAARGAARGRGLDLLARKLVALRDRLQSEGGKSLQVHLVGHSAGTILLGHLLGKLAAAPLRIATCTLYAAACSVRFAVQKYLDEAKPILSSTDIALHYLTDANEKRDYLAGSRHFHLYGKSLLYLVSRALDDKRKMPLLGFERAVEPGYEANADQWVASEHDALREWQRRFKGTLAPVAEPNIAVAANGKTVQATHGSFDNNVRVIAATIERITGSKPVKPIEWLDY